MAQVSVSKIHMYNGSHTRKGYFTSLETIFPLDPKYLKGWGNRQLTTRPSSIPFPAWYGTQANFQIKNTHTHTHDG